MPRVLRSYLLGCVALAAAYLVLHVGEPLRLDLGDAWSDAGIALGQTPAGSGPPRDALAGYLYRAIALLGIDDLRAHRGLALALSGLGAWWLFQYARWMWDAATALLATALLATSLLWLQTADGLERPPLVLAGCFLALWGTARAIETGRRRHAAASACGAFVCVLAGPDLRLFLPAGLLFTIHARRGDPFAWRNLRFVAPGAIGCLAGALAGALIAGDVVDAGLDARLDAAAPGMIWRATAALTPMCWVTAGVACWRALRAASPRRALEDAPTWMLAAAAVGLAVVDPSGRMVDALPALPFYAIGSALAIARLLTAGGLRRALGLAWAAAAPVWAFVLVLASPRTVLDRDDVDRARAYLAGADGNDLVITNLVADGVIEVAFDRRAVPAVEPGEDAHDVPLARRWVLGLFESAGTDYLHAVIVHSPATPSRDALDRLAAVGAQPVLQLRDFDVYRVDRAAVLAVASRAVPVVRRIDFASAAGDPHKLLGWSDPELNDDGLGVSRIVGYNACANPIPPPRAAAPARNACETERTPKGLRSVDERYVDRAQLMIRVDRPCDLRLTLTLASAPQLGVAINGFTASQCAAEPRAEFLVPARFVHAGINVLTIAKREREPEPEPRAEPAPRGDAEPPSELRGAIRALAIDPVCAPAP